MRKSRLQNPCVLKYDYSIVLGHWTLNKILVSIALLIFFATSMFNSQSAFAGSGAGNICIDSSDCIPTVACMILGCEGGVCVDQGNFLGCCASNAQCDDANQCTDDICNLDTNTCLNPNDPDGQSCDDFERCTEPDTCQSGVCTGGPNLCVSGTPLPIDTTAVLVAGTQTTALWMIPVIVSAAGIAVVLARKFSKYQPI